MENNIPKHNKNRKIYRPSPHNLPTARTHRGSTGQAIKFLKTVTALAAEPRDRRTLITQIACELMTYLDGDATTVFMYGDSGEFEFASSSGLKAAFATEIERLGRTFWTHAFSSGQPAPITHSVLGEPFASPLHRRIHDEGFNTLISVPLEREDRLLGVIVVFGRGDLPLGANRFSAVQVQAQITSMALMNNSMAEQRRWEQVAQEQYLDILSHELRTPLTSIIGFAQILRRRAGMVRDFDVRMREQLSLLYSQAQRLNRLLDTFLDISNIERGTLELVYEQVDLTSLVRAAVDQSRTETRSSHPTEIDIPDKAIWISGDSKRLENIFGHVVLNAYRYSPDDATVRITCEETSGTSDNNMVRVSVVDGGPGIPSELRREIFKRYYPSDTRRAGGMGVGLFVSRAIVEAHGGALKLDSIPGEGTRVSIELPTL